MCLSTAAAFASCCSQRVEIERSARAVFPAVPVIAGKTNIDFCFQSGRWNRPLLPESTIAHTNLTRCKQSATRRSETRRHCSQLLAPRCGSDTCLRISPQLEPNKGGHPGCTASEVRQALRRKAWAKPTRPSATSTTARPRRRADGRAARSSCSSLTSRCTASTVRRLRTVYGCLTTRVPASKPQKLCALRLKRGRDVIGADDASSLLVCTLDVQA